jgi:GrpB-like predicted nucleotidyltransferase (UPF0157 family)
MTTPSSPTPTGPSLGLEAGVVRLVEYDHRWPALFTAESARLRTAIGPLDLRLAHIGSTAVPGLASKPVLDILAGYRDPDARAGCIGALIAAGYQYRGEQSIPGRDFFRRGDPRAYHLHLAQVDSAFWEEHLAFRDLLRGNAVLRDAYGSLKRELAARFPRDRGGYIDAKGPFVRQALSQAHRRSVP